MKRGPLVTVDKYLYLGRREDEEFLFYVGHLLCCTMIYDHCFLVLL